MTDPGVLALLDEIIARDLRTRGRKRDPLWKRALAARANGRRVVKTRRRACSATGADVDRGSSGA